MREVHAKNTEVDRVIEEALTLGRRRMKEVLKAAGGVVSAPEAARMLGISQEELAAKEPLIILHHYTPNKGIYQLDH